MIVTQEDKDVLANRARPDIDENGHAPAVVDETVVFRMKDNFHSFSLDLETILRCLAFAESEGAVPELPQDWWISMHRRYSL